VAICLTSLRHKAERSHERLVHETERVLAQERMTGASTPRNEGLETHFKNARAVRIVPRTTDEIDVIKDALTKYLRENNIASEISNIEKLENEGYVINVRVKNLDQYAGSGSLYNKLYDIVLENGSQATIVLNLEPM